MEQFKEIQFDKYTLRYSVSTTVDETYYNIYNTEEGEEGTYYDFTQVRDVIPAAANNIITLIQKLHDVQFELEQLYED